MPPRTEKAWNFMIPRLEIVALCIGKATLGSIVIPSNPVSVKDTIG